MFKARDTRLERFVAIKQSATEFGDRFTREARAVAAVQEPPSAPCTTCRPEQARGQTAIGPQSDQFSFGLILYELVTGRKAFARDSSAETLTAIIREDAAPLPGSVPAPLRWIIERLLAKDPSERYESSRDLYRELKQLRDRLSDATAPLTDVTTAVSAAPIRRLRVGWLVPLIAALALAAVASVVTWTLVPRGEAGAVDLSPYRFTPISLDAAAEENPVWSPDGRSLAYTALIDGVPQLMVREVGAPTSRQLIKATIGVRFPFWAPDGTRVYFLRGPGFVALVGERGGW